MKGFISILSIVLVLLIGSCGDPASKLNIDVSHIDQPKIKIKRYEQAMFPVPSDSFLSVVPRLQDEYAIFLQGNIKDTAALIQLKSFFVNPYMIELYKSSMEKYPSLAELEDELSDALQYYYYYFPYAQEYQYYSYVSGLDINAPIKFMGDNIVIGLDNYLGGDDARYLTSGFPMYQIKWAIPERIVPDCMNEMASAMMPEQANGESLLENMIYQGKILYFTQAMNPSIADSLLLKYSTKQYQWCSHYEPKIWGLMIDNQFLFKKEQKLVGKFMNDGPFTTVFSRQAPARIGWYVGWRIVSEYMNRTDASMNELMQENDAQKILRLSKYKPKD